MKHRSLITALALITLASVGPAAPAGAETGHHRHPVASRSRSYELYNVNNTAVTCSTDKQQHHVHAQLIGPRSRAGIPQARVNVMIHGLGTGGWFWHLPGHAAQDYATQLARKGQTSLVVDQLGYGKSPLRDGTATCLGAQADMLHQIIVSLRASGTSQVIVHAAGTGVPVAEVEAATWHDASGLVLMSWADQGESRREMSTATKQTLHCIQGAGYASFAASDSDFASLLFATAATGVRKAAVARRAADPCGDAESLTSLMATAAQDTASIEVPVLLLDGGRDPLLTQGSPAAQRNDYGAKATVTAHLYGAASGALTLEKQAPTVRRDVLRWLTKSFHTPPV